MTKGKTVKIKVVKEKPKPVSASTVKAMITRMSEKKFYQVEAQTTADTTWTIQSAFVPPQGDTDVTRDGDQVYLKDFEISGAIGFADSTNVIRLTVLRWYDDSTPTVDEIYELGANDAVNMFRPFRKDTSGTYHIMYDKVFAVANTGPGVQHFKKRVFGKKLGRKVVKFRGGSTNGYGKIYICRQADSGTSVHPSVVYCARTNYTDS